MSCSSIGWVWGLLLAHPGSSLIWCMPSSHYVVTIWLVWIGFAPGSIFKMRGSTWEFPPDVFHRKKEQKKNNERKKNYNLVFGDDFSFIWIRWMYHVFFFVSISRWHPPKPWRVRGRLLKSPQEAGNMGIHWHGMSNR